MAELTRTVNARRLGISESIRTEPFFHATKGRPEREMQPDISCNGNLVFEIHYHANKQAYAVERFYLPNLGNYAFFGESIEDCVLWIEDAYGIKIRIVD